jgi:thioredoxin 1
MENQPGQKHETFQQLIYSSIPVLVDFYADWCGPCKAMNPVIREVAGEVKDKARVIKVNIDQSEQAAGMYNINAVPTFMIFKQGRPLWRHSGMIDKYSLLKAIQSTY